MSQTLPVDYNLIRKKFANIIQEITGRPAILSEPEVQNQPRPALPYFTYKFLGPATKSGDDSKSYDSDTQKWNSGGVRKLSMSFQVYGNSHEEAYNLMGQLQTALDLEDVIESLRSSGIAVWVIGNVVDLSLLIDTGYEGRAQLDVSFGIAMNLESDLGSIEKVSVEGEVEVGETNPVDLEIDVEE